MSKKDQNNRIQLYIKEIIYIIIFLNNHLFFSKTILNNN